MNESNFRKSYKPSHGGSAEATGSAGPTGTDEGNGTEGSGIDGFAGGSKASKMIFLVN